MKQQKNIYLTNEQLAEALIESQQAGLPTQKVCEYFRMIASHMIGNYKFRHYTKEMHEDLVSAALVKCIKNIHNFKPEYKSSCFNYYTRCVEHAFFEVLSKHYKHINIKHELNLEYANELEHFNSILAKKVRDYNTKANEL